MEGLYYVASLIGILLLLRWSVRAEASGDTSTGLFAITEVPFDRKPYWAPRPR